MKTNIALGRRNAERGTPSPKVETQNSKLTGPPRHRMISEAATRLHRRRGLTRWWLAQAGATAPRSADSRVRAFPNPIQKPARLAQANVAQVSKPAVSRVS